MVEPLTRTRITQICAELGRDVAPEITDIVLSDGTRLLRGNFGYWYHPGWTGGHDGDIPPVRPDDVGAASDLIQENSPPSGDSIDRAARELAVARRAQDGATEFARQVVVAAVNDGMSEAEAARRVGVTRMTVRDWLGK